MKLPLNLPEVECPKCKGKALLHTMFTKPEDDRVCILMQCLGCTTQFTVYGTIYTSVKWKTEELHILEKGDDAK